MITALRNRWHADGGYRQLLAVAVPLMLSTGSSAIYHFVDRVFLTWYSSDAVAASMPAGIVSFTVMCLFLGTASYAGTFVSQYHGAGRNDRIGPAIWQGNYVALIGGVLIACMIPLAKPFFDFVGHDPAVRSDEIAYFRILCLGAFPMIASSTMAGFFSGRGKTWPVMWITVVAVLFNIIADYILIFGKLGFPVMGIRGAAVATVLASWGAATIYLVLLCRPKHNRVYHTISGWRPDRKMFVRLLRFGTPNGIQFFLDIAGFSIFILLVGRLGRDELAASTIAFNINSLAFMPMMGCGIAVSMLVGQNLGRNKPEIAAKSAWSGFHLTIIYMTSIAFLYVAVPNLFIAPFAAQANGEDFAQIRATAIVLLRFVAVYSIFDTLNLIFGMAVKGAGDTRYVMFMIVVLSLTVLVIPSYVALVVFDAGLYVGWLFITAYVSLLGGAFLLRFLGGKWKTMRVIEEVPPMVGLSIPEAPGRGPEL